MSRAPSLAEVQRAGERRLRPALTDPNWLVLRKRRELFRNWIRAHIGAGPRVLDVGGRLQPYRSLFAQPQRYLSVDLQVTPLVEVVADAGFLPFSDEAFDVVVCTQMLEYAPEPGAVVAEIYRVLQDPGWLLLSVPAIFPRDSSGDAWRFLPAGIAHLLAAFEEVEIVSEGGSVAGLFRTLNVCFDLFARYAILRSAFKYTLVPAMNLAGHLLENLLGNGNDQLAANYSVLARKRHRARGSLNGLVQSV